MLGGSTQFPQSPQAAEKGKKGKEKGNFSVISDSAQRINYMPTSFLF
jgi:hypothetical protein